MNSYILPISYFSPIEEGRWERNLLTFLLPNLFAPLPSWCLHPFSLTHSFQKMQAVNSFSRDDGARGVAPCCRTITVLEQGLKRKVGDKTPLLQLMLIVTICCNAGWGMSRSGPVIYLVLPVNYNKHHVNGFNYLQSCSSMIEI